MPRTCLERGRASLPFSALCATVVMLVMSAWVPGAKAQALYRCGATYQDRPCAGVDSKVVSRGARRVEPSDGWAVEPMCRDRGALAQKIVWEKESGRTLDEQLARNEFDVNLVKKIYALRGSSVEVRRVIEADCVKELERPPDPALSRVNTGNPPALPPPVPGQGAAGAGRQPDAHGANGQSGVAVATKAEKCAAASAELEGLRALQRNGGDAQTMDELAARVRQAQSRKRAAGC